MIGTDAFQEIDTYGLTVPITKHNFLVRSAAELLDVASRRVPRRRVGTARVRWSSTCRRTCRLETIEVDAPARRPAAPDAPPTLRPADDRARAAALLDGRAAAGAARRRRRDRVGRVPTCCDGSPSERRFPVAATLLGLGAMPARPSALPRHGRHARRALHQPPARGVRSAGRPRRPLRRSRHRQGGRVLPARAASCTSTSTRASSARSSSRRSGSRADVGDVAARPRAAAGADLRGRHGRRASRACARRIRSPRPGVDDPLHALRHHPSHGGARRRATRSSRATSASTRCGWRRRSPSAARASGSPRAGSARWASACPAAIGAALALPRSARRLLHRRRQPADEPAGARHRRRGSASTSR